MKCGRSNYVPAHSSKHVRSSEPRGEVRLGKVVNMRTGEQLGSMVLYSDTFHGVIEWT